MFPSNLPSDPFSLLPEVAGTRTYCHNCSSVLHPNLTTCSHCHILTGVPPSVTPAYLSPHGYMDGGMAAVPTSAPYTQPLNLTSRPRSNNRYHLNPYRPVPFDVNTSPSQFPPHASEPYPYADASFPPLSGTPSPYPVDSNGIKMAGMWTAARSAGPNLQTPPQKYPPGYNPLHTPTIDKGTLDSAVCRSAPTSSPAAGLPNIGIKGYSYPDTDGKTSEEWKIAPGASQKSPASKPKGTRRPRGRPRKSPSKKNGVRPNLGSSGLSLFSFPSDDKRLGKFKSLPAKRPRGRPKKNLVAVKPVDDFMDSEMKDEEEEDGEEEDGEEGDRPRVGDDKTFKPDSRTRKEVKLGIPQTFEGQGSRRLSPRSVKKVDYGKF